jgi:dienelactone hydrolase
MKRLLTLVLIFSAVSVQAALKTEVVEYKDGKTVLEGYIAYDDSDPGQKPGVLVIHEWWGHGPYVRKRAEQLAELGYIAFAIDMYGKGVRAKDHEEAGKLSGPYREDRNMTRKRARAALDFFTKRSRVNPTKVAAIGYCFGGMAALEMARAGMDLSGVASFHGPLAGPLPAEPGKVKAKVIVFHGAADKFVADGVAPFQEEMTNAKADWQLVTYADAVHAFTVPDAGNDPSTGMAYNEKADKRSWEALKDFLAEAFK